jgi:hypothetical protein
MALTALRFHTLDAVPLWMKLLDTSCGVIHSNKRIESAHFLPHSGVRFPKNPCSNCPYVGLCLGKPQTSETRLVRRPGAENLG